MRCITRKRLATCTVICFYFVRINSRQEKFTLKYIRTRAMCSIVTRTNKIFGLNNFRTRGGLYENFSITKNKQITDSSFLICISIDIVYDNDLTDALVVVLKDMIKLDLQIFRYIVTVLNN